MGVLINPESDYAKEIAKWERPYRYERFPAMLYKAHEAKNGKWLVGDPADEAFSRQCQRIVHTEDEERAARNDGWRETPTEALAFAERVQQDIARAAAEANFAAQRMSEKAQADRKRREDATHKHVAE